MRSLMDGGTNCDGQSFSSHCSSIHLSIAASKEAFNRVLISPPNPSLNNRPAEIPKQEHYGALRDNHRSRHTPISGALLNDDVRVHFLTPFNTFGSIVRSAGSGCLSF